MPRTTRVATGLGALALATALAACSSSGGASGGSSGSATTSAAASSSAATSAPASDTSSATTATDYASLLIEASDIPVAGFEKGTPEAPPQGDGTTVAFTGEGGRAVGDSIVVLQSAEAAQAAAAAAVTSATASVTDPEVTQIPLGQGGTAIRGTSSSGEVAVVVFSEAKAFCVIEFDSPAGDPVPTDVVQQVATAQDTKIKGGLTD